jgi:hypothetical protein
LADDLGKIFHEIHSKSMKGGTKTQSPSKKEMAVTIQKLEQQLGEQAVDLGEPCDWGQIVLACLIIIALASGTWWGASAVCASHAVDLGNVAYAHYNYTTSQFAAAALKSGAGAKLKSPALMKEAYAALELLVKNWWFARGVERDTQWLMGLNPRGSAATQAFIKLLRVVCNTVPKRGILIPWDYVWGGFSAFWWPKEKSEEELLKMISEKDIQKFMLGLVKDPVARTAFNDAVRASFPAKKSVSPTHHKRTTRRHHSLSPQSRSRVQLALPEPAASTKRKKKSLSPRAIKTVRKRKGKRSSHSGNISNISGTDSGYST